jgi:hypothetical protein
MLECFETCANFSDPHPECILPTLADLALKELFVPASSNSPSSC